MIKTCQSLPGWWYTYPSEKYEFVKWDYCSQYMENNPVMFQTTNQQLTDLDANSVACHVMNNM
jgi:hypothetical protein